MHQKKYLSREMSQQRAIRDRTKHTYVAYLMSMRNNFQKSFSLNSSHLEIVFARFDMLTTGTATW